MIDILKITIPALLVLLTAFLLLNNLLRNENNRRKYELKIKNSSETIKIRLQAYERLALLLERTSPATMILGIITPGMLNIELQKELLSNIRKEFSHNISQQIYVSDELWNAILIVRENLLKIVNSMAAEIAPDAQATELAEQIISVYNSTSHSPTEQALALLKKEVRELI